MTEGQASEPPQGTPGRRALGAMESAVRRAREAAGEPPAPPVGRPPDPPRPPRPPRPSDLVAQSDSRPVPSAPSEEVTPRPVATPVARQEGDVVGSPGSARDVWRDRWLFGAVIAAAVLVVVAAAALGVSLSDNGTPSSSQPPIVAAPHGPGPTTTGQAGMPSGAANSRGNRGSTGTSTSAPASPTTSLPSSPGAAPVISTLDPPSGAVGQGIEVAGANFLSSNGQIVATFNGQVAPTSCADQNTCTVTVPPMSGSNSAQVTITTASGTSNPVTFSYS
jgi:IPT/TIG domain-containing protein